METKALVEGALLAGITVVMTVLGLYLPLGSFLLILTPLPLIVLAARRNSNWSIIASIVNTIILMMLANPSLIFLTIFYTGLVGVFMGAAFEEKFSAGLILTVGTIGVIISFTVSLLIGSYIFNIDLLGQVKEAFELGANIYSELGISNQALKEVTTQVINLLKQTYPVLLLCSSLLVAIVNYYFSVKVLNRFSEFDYPPLFLLEEIKLPKAILIIYFLAAYFSQQLIWMNIYILTTFMLLLEGVAVAYYYLLAGKLNKLMIIIGILFFPLTTQALFLVGLADILFDFRTLNKG
ncbi:hypothetical protein JCM16358_15160 [Halanaerocella petrolearia]